MIQALAPPEHLEMHPDVLATVDRGLLTALAEAKAHVAETEAQVLEAFARLNTHQDAVPVQASGVTAWAKRKAQLVDELGAYETIQERAEQARSTAQETLEAAYATQWRIAYDAATQAVLTVYDQAEARLDAWRRQGAVIRYENAERFHTVANARESLKWTRPPRVTTEETYTDDSEVRIRRQGVAMTYTDERIAQEELAAARAKEPRS